MEIEGKWKWLKKVNLLNNQGFERNTIFFDEQIHNVILRKLMIVLEKQGDKNKLKMEVKKKWINGMKLRQECFSVFF